MEQKENTKMVLTELIFRRLVLLLLANCNWESLATPKILNRFVLVLSFVVKRDFSRKSCAVDYRYFYFIFPAKNFLNSFIWKVCRIRKSNSSSHLKKKSKNPTHNLNAVFFNTITTKDNLKTVWKVLLSLERSLDLLSKTFKTLKKGIFHCISHYNFFFFFGGGGHEQRVSLDKPSLWPRTVTSIGLLIFL